MSITDPPPPDGDLASLFARERRAQTASAGRQARVWSRLEKSLTIGPADPNGGGGGASVPVTSAPPLAQATSRLLARLSIAACLIAASGLVWTAASMNAPAPARVVATPDAPPRSLVRTSEPKAATTTSANVPSVSVNALPSALTAPSAREVAAPPRAPCTICDERAILDAGRRGLREKQYDVALASIADHQARFASGQLAEERESLRVHVLVAMGRTDDAERSRADFRRAFPDSPLLDSVERAGAK